MWVRGLKSPALRQAIDVLKSHPMWVRGLKSKERYDTAIEIRVAPYVGAWIEISNNH